MYLSWINSMNLQVILIYIITGLLLQFLASKFPFRKLEQPREYKWDIASVLGATLFSALFWMLLGTPLIIFFLDMPWISSLQPDISAIPPILIGLIQLLFTDFLFYWAHRLLHTQLFWHAHAWHHAPKHLWWLAGLRASPLHVVLMGLPLVISYLAFPTAQGGTMIVILIIIRVLNQHWIHSNVRFPFERQLEWIFVTPRVHFVHHHVERRFSDKNFGFIFSFWDRLFGTFVHPDVVQGEKLGLNYKNTNLRLLLGVPPKNKKIQEKSDSAFKDAQS